jgi:hypothetical protein
MEPECDFTDMSAALVMHLTADHLIQVHKLSYARPSCSKSIIGAKLIVPPSIGKQ